jgi:hypothetical protein
MGEAKGVGDKIDALVCAIRMLVGQMQAEAEVEYRLQVLNGVVDEGDNGYHAALGDLKDARRRAAGLHGEAR